MNQQQGYDDMCTMETLTQQKILENLSIRYNKDMIFTNIGTTLIAVNPYKQIPDLFSETFLSEFAENILKGKPLGIPHIYLIAGKAFYDMKNQKPKQAIIISGQSGAGKTESTKYCMQMLTKLSSKKSNVQRKILACNPLLQAFGNSKTVRNENSSRFGKYVQILFGRDSTIKGARIQSYLLEKSRVTMVSRDQRNFHVFYALTVAGLFGAQSAEKYNYLNRSGTLTANNIDDRKLYTQIKESFGQIGFTESQQEKIWKLLLAILELGNIQFDDTQHQKLTTNPCKILNKTSFSFLLRTFEISQQQLQRILLYKTRVGNYSTCNKIQCQANRDTLSKALYNFIFQAIIDKIEIALKPDQQQNVSQMLLQQSALRSKHSQIGILDIFGFQNFEKNSIEQICINYTNEKLLDQYNKKVFEGQINILIADGLQDQIKDIDPPSNQQIILRLGQVFKVINQQTPRAFPEVNIVDSLKAKYPKSQQIKFAPTDKLVFKINHSACFVSYSIEGFKVKNLDDLTPDISDLCTKIFQIRGPQQSKKKKTILNKFQQSIGKLIETLSQSSNHFVRCIKTNEQKRPNFIRQDYMLKQIKYLGVFETIKIRKAIFPCRKTYEQFSQKYQDIFIQSRGKTHRQAAKIIIQKIKANQAQYRFGNSRIYMKDSVEEKLQAQLKKYMKIIVYKIRKIQQKCRLFCKKRSQFRKWQRERNQEFEKKFSETLQKKIKSLLYVGIQYIKQESEHKLQQNNKPAEIQREQQRIQDNETNLDYLSTRPFQLQTKPSLSKFANEQLIQRNQLLENSIIEQQTAFENQRKRLQKQKLDQFQVMNNFISRRKTALKLQQSQNQILKQKIHNYESQIQKYVQSIDRMVLENQRQKSLKKQIIEQRNHLLTEIQLKNNKIAQMQTQNEEMKLKLQTKIQEAQQKYEKLQQKNHKYFNKEKEIIQKNTSRIKQLQEMVKDYETVIETYKFQKQVLQTEKISLHKKLSDKIGKIQDLKQKIQTTSKNQLSSKDQQIKKLKDKIIHLQIEINENYQKQSRKSQDLYELQLKLYSHQNNSKDYDNPEILIKDLQIEELNAKLAFQKKRVEKLEQKQKNQTEKINFYINRYTKQTKQLKQLLKMADKQKTRDNFTITQCKIQIERLKKQIETKSNRDNHSQNLYISEQQLVNYIKSYQKGMDPSQRLKFKENIIKQFIDQ